MHLIPLKWNQLHCTQLYWTELHFTKHTSLCITAPTLKLTNMHCKYLDYTNHSVLLELHHKLHLFACTSGHWTLNLKYKSRFVSIRVENTPKGAIHMQKNQKYCNTCAICFFFRYIFFSWTFYLNVYLKVVCACKFALTQCAGRGCEPWRHRKRK